MEHGVTAEAVTNEDDWLGRIFFVDILDDLLHLFDKFFIIGWRRSDFPSSILQKNAGIALLIDLVPVRDMQQRALGLFEQEPRLPTMRHVRRVQNDTPRAPVDTGPARPNAWPAQHPRKHPSPAETS